MTGDTVYVSGGKDRGMVLSSVWDVIEAGDKLIDPETGDALGRAGGTRVGRLRVVSVEDKYSVAELVDGRCDVGQALVLSAAAPR